MEYPVAVQPSEPDLVSADDFADAIVARWQDSVLAIIDVGKLLLGAKEALPHGEFGPMIESDRVPFSSRTAQRLMEIAEHSLLSNATRASHLPPSWMTVYELTKVPDDALGGWHLGTDPLCEKCLEDANKAIQKNKQILQEMG